MTTAETYVTAAYLVIFVAVLVYVLIIATKLSRLEREVAELVELARRRSHPTAEASEREAAPVG